MSAAAIQAEIIADVKIFMHEMVSIHSSKARVVEWSVFVFYIISMFFSLKFLVSTKFTMFDGIFILAVFLMGGILFAFESKAARISKESARKLRFSIKVNVLKLDKL
jgi:hypothetical protein